MKKLLLYIATALFLVGCAQDFDLAERSAPEPQQAAATTGTLTRSLDGAVYNEIIDGWMIPQADPFALENVQAAYDKLAEERSAQTLSKSEAAEFQAGKKLAPTHYALKIYPKSEEEQWRVEMMEDVKVTYIPFCYSRLTQEETARVEQSGKTRSAANTFAEKSPYTVTHDYTEVTDGGPTGPVTYQLPILYTVWPADKPLPDDLEYVVDYEIFKPDTATQTISSKVLTRANNQLFSGSTIYLYRQQVFGRLMTYDDNIGKNVPLANMVIKVEDDGFSLSRPCITDSNGYFVLYYGAQVGDIVRFSPLYTSHSGLWKITGSVGSTIPYQGDPFFEFEFQDFIPGGSLGTIVLPAGDRQENVIHRAVNYFFNDQTDFSSKAISTAVKIVAHSGNGNSSGSFATPSTINIQNNGGSIGAVIGTTLHELGHFTHYQNASSVFRLADDFLRESFARYSGWYLGEKYYKSSGWVHPGGNPQIAGPSEQSWYKTYARTFPWDKRTFYYGWYSPLFIDLTDNYNQGASYPHFYPVDKIQGVSPSSVWNIVKTSTTWFGAGQCREKIVNLAGSSTDFNQWIDDFDTWANTYPLK